MGERKMIRSQDYRGLSMLKIQNTTTRLLLLCLLCLLAVPVVSRGDTIFLKDGRKLEGKVVSEKGDHVEIDTKFGRAKIEKSRIAKIVRGETAEDEYRKRLKALDKEDPNAVFALAEWARAKGMKKEYRKLLEMTVKANPQHEGANKALGKVKYDGRWFTPSELNVYKKDEDKRMKAQGYIKLDGKWISQAEFNKHRGYQLYEDEWISRMDFYHKTGERDIEKFFGHPLTITDAEHFTIRSSYAESVHLELLDNCELEYEHFIRTFKPDPIEDRMLWYYPTAIYILEDIDECDLFIDSGYIKRYDPPTKVLGRYAHSTNFSLYFPQPLVVLSKGRHLVGSQDKMTSQIGFMTHHVGHILIRRFKCGGPVPPWIETGVAHYYEGLTNFSQTVSVCEYEGFEDVQKWTDGWGNFMEWRKKLTDASTHNSLPTVQEMFNLELGTINSRQMAKAWSVVTYLIKKHPDEFMEYTRRALAPYRGVKRLPNADAWKLGFKDITPEQIEKEWRSWIVTQPLVPTREDKLELDEDPK